ncbi:MAG: hypothetical protein IKK24_00665 [Clostridia bacterium]|nr:hypothetical protein [Clostridia bacterium]
MKKTVNSIRVAVDNWLNEERFNKLLEILKKYPGEIGQVALFTQNYHTPMPLEVAKEYAEIMKVRMQKIREAGFSAGINVLCTIGHHNENLENCYCDDSYRMTNIKGDVCEGSYCMRDPRFWENYVKPVYRLFAKAEPEFIWIDDDVRCDHFPIGRGCFCDGCIAKFNEKYGYNYTRETLREEFNARNITLRKQWLKHNGGGAVELVEYIGKTVREVSPNIILGFMTCPRYFENYDFKTVAEALSENGKYQIMWRPGGGVYTDYCMQDFLNKLHDIGMQNANLPDYVISVQSEIENFPYQLIKKSPCFTAMEGLLYMTAGCTGTAFNILPSDTLEPIENCIPHLKAINDLSAEYKIFHEKLAGKKPAGISVFWKNDMQAYAYGEWVESYAGPCATEIFDFGLPECYRNDKGVCTVLDEFAVITLSDEELLEILSSGVYMDARALALINERGFGEYTGFSVGESIPVDAIEKYLPHSLNEGIAGNMRNCRQSFNFGPSFALYPSDKAAEPLCKLVDYSGKTLTECSMGLFENKLGGRVAIGGYFPFSMISAYSKALQLIRVFTYISKNKIPAYIDGYFRIKSTAFTDGEKMCVTLFNPSPDTVSEIPVNLLTDKGSITCYSGDKAEKLSVTNTAGDYQKFIIPKIGPYKIILIEI